MIEIKTIIKFFKEKEERSQWNKGINEYAIDILNRYADYNNTDIMPPLKVLQKELLIGAPDWKQYSYGGCALINRYDITERLFRPNKRKNLPDTWKELDEQANALQLAYYRIKFKYMMLEAKLLMEKKNV